MLDMETTEASTGHSSLTKLKDEESQTSANKCTVNEELCCSEITDVRHPCVSPYFEDRKRAIDYVLVYTKNPEEVEKEKFRNLFQTNMKKEGLQLEETVREHSHTHFVKIHAPWSTLARFAGVMKLEMPLARNDVVNYKSESHLTIFDHNASVQKPIPRYFSAPFSLGREFQFIIEDYNTFFSPSQRSLITYHILTMLIYDDVKDKAKNKFGIDELLATGVYKTGFPLHDGDYDITPGSSSPDNERRLLYETWAKAGNWYKYQPLDHVHHYFGEKIAIYFVWLGFYTNSLMLPGFCGLMISIFAFLGNDSVNGDICDENRSGNLTMCPLCEKCQYWRLSDNCNRLHKFGHSIDNYLGVAFSVFIALWAVIFLKRWTRHNAELHNRWSVQEYEDQLHVRPQYMTSKHERKVHPSSGKEEPYISAGSKCLRYTCSWSVFVFMISLAFAFSLGIVLYRISLVSVLLYKGQMGQEASPYLVFTTASIINVVGIRVLGFVYLRLAKRLTDLEFHRTQKAWENSFTVKMFAFQFINYYSSLFYIAFVKGNFVGRPGRYNRDQFGNRFEECMKSGCFIELAVQLTVIMVGTQSLGNVVEISTPLFLNWIRSRKITREESYSDANLARWEKDYMMKEAPDNWLFSEYFEIVLQYGFVTIFVAAFPPAPLIALINNVIEIRLDAYKFITQYRRPLGARTKDIGMWSDILKCITQIAVITNACIIAFDSELIPKLLYQYVYSHNDTDSLDGYMNFRLSVFNVSDFEKASLPYEDGSKSGFGNVQECRYMGFRNPQNSTEPYEYNKLHFEVLSLKLMFALLFVLVVNGIGWIIYNVVPDVPKHIRILALREKYLAKEALMQEYDIKHWQSIVSSIGFK